MVSPHRWFLGRDFWLSSCFLLHQQVMKSWETKRPSLGNFIAWSGSGTSFSESATHYGGIIVQFAHLEGSDNSSSSSCSTLRVPHTAVSPSLAYLWGLKSLRWDGQRAWWRAGSTEEGAILMPEASSSDPWSVFAGDWCFPLSRWRYTTQREHFSAFSRLQAVFFSAT